MAWDLDSALTEYEAARKEYEDAVVAREAEEGYGDLHRNFYRVENKRACAFKTAVQFALGMEAR